MPRAAGGANDEVFLIQTTRLMPISPESRTKRSLDRVACFLHLRDLVYLHPGAASASAVTFSAVGRSVGDR